jgi:hypothetical protein
MNIDVGVVRHGVYFIPRRDSFEKRLANKEQLFRRGGEMTTRFETYRRTAHHSPTSSYILIFLPLDFFTGSMLQ